QQFSVSEFVTEEIMGCATLGIAGRPIWTAEKYQGLWVRSWHRLLSRVNFWGGNSSKVCLKRLKKQVERSWLLWQEKAFGEVRDELIIFKIHPCHACR